MHLFKFKEIYLIILSSDSLQDMRLTKSSLMQILSSFNINKISFILLILSFNIFILFITKFSDALFISIFFIILSVSSLLHDLYNISSICSLVKNSFFLLNAISLFIFLKFKVLYEFIILLYSLIFSDDSLIIFFLVFIFVLRQSISSLFLLFIVLIFSFKIFLFFFNSYILELFTLLLIL